MIKNIVFDMGNVLIIYDPEFFVSRRGFTGEDAELLLNTVFLSEEWGHIDDGTMLEEEMIEVARKKLPKRLHAAAEDLIMHWEEPYTELPGMTELIRELKERGYRIFLLSNTSHRQREYWGNLSFSEYFEGTLISAEEKTTKPGAKIFRTFLERFSLNAGECVFIDDAEKNVNAARSAGMAGIVFRGSEALREELLKLL